jgi:hypothetical protein
MNVSVYGARADKDSCAFAQIAPLARVMSDVPTVVAKRGVCNAVVIIRAGRFER